MQNFRFYSLKTISGDKAPAGGGSLSSSKRMARRRAMGRVGLLMLTLLLALCPLWADHSGDYYKHGKAAEIRKQYDLAYAYYQRALAIEPNNVEYILSARRARFEAAMGHVQRGRQFLAQKHYPEAQAEYEKALSLDPSNDVARQELARLQQILHPPPPPPGQAVTAEQEGSLSERLARAAGPIALGQVAATPINLKLAGDSRVAYSTLGKLSGINVIFDPDYHGTHVTLNLRQVSLLESLRILGIEARSFYTVVTPNTIFVTNDTLQKRSELEQMVVKTFYLHNISQPQDLTEIANAVRVLLNLQHFQPVASQMALVIRDTPDKVAVAQKIIDDLDKAPPEVVVKIQVLQVNTDVARDLGILPPTSTTISLNPTTPTTSTSSTSSTSTTSSTPSSTTAVTTLNDLKHLNGNNFQITISPATLNALLSNDSTRTMQEPELRAINGQKATLQIGERIPIATGSFQPGIGGVGINPLVNTQFTYQPVGVNIDITPWIHGDREVTLKTHIEISAVDNYVTIGGIQQPVIGQKVVDHTVELRNGESNVLGGILQDQDIKNISGIPGLSSIPLFKWLFSTTHTELIHTEVMIVMTPLIVRHLDISRFDERAIDTGTQNNITLHELPPATLAPAAPAPEPGTPVQPRPPVPMAAPPSGTARPSGPPAPAARPGASARVSAQPLLRVEPQQIQGMVGNPFGVNIGIDNAVNAYALSFQLNYDPQMMSLKSVVNAGFLGRDGKAVALVDRNDPTTGSVQITLSRPPNVGGVSGSGVVLSLTFEGKGAGMRKISISHLVARDPQGRIVPIGTAGATVTIR